MLNKSTEAAIAAMSRLAEVYDGGATTLTAAELAESRNLQRPFLAKILTALSQAGLVTGTPGRRGGYSLARSPATIRLSEIADCFERREPAFPCPFGPGHCGHAEPCPVHDQVMAIRNEIRRFLERTNLAVFRR